MEWMNFMANIYLVYVGKIINTDNNLICAFSKPSAGDHVHDEMSYAENLMLSP